MTSVDPSIPAVLIKSLQIGGAAVSTDVTIMGGTVTYGESQHDQADLQIKTPSSDYANWVSQPISFLFGPRLLERVFSGYVKTAAPSGATSMSQDSGSITVSSLGVTYKLRQGRPRFWSNVLVSDAISDIVSPSQLGITKEPNDSFSWESKAQTVETDWTKILELAGDNGYSIFVSDGVVRVCDPTRLLKTSGYAVQLTQMAANTDTTHNMFEWDSQYDVDTLTENTFFPVFSYLNKSGQVVYSTALGPGKYLYTAYPVRSQEMAQAITSGVMRSTGNWACTGTARIRGNAALLPGDVVTVRISPTTSTVNKDDGPWLVTDVQHTLSTNSFQTQLMLKRQQQFVAEDPNVATWRPYFVGDSRGAPKLFLLQGDWVSTWRGATKP